MAAKFLGQFLLEQGLVDRQQLLVALETQRNSNLLLGELAQASGMLDYIQAARINERQRREDKRFGEVALEMDLLTIDQLDVLLRRQKEKRKLFGDILVEQGVLGREQLADALLAQRHERNDAIEALELGVAGHPSGDLMSGTIDTCTRLFPRLLRTQCQFSSLVGSTAGLDRYAVTARVRVAGDRPSWVGVACDATATANIAGAFLSMPAEDCDAALAEDALGELVNVLMGYIVKDALANIEYRVLPPDFGISAADLLAGDPKALAVAMTSQLGSFLLVVAG
jgi:hypothetical protein